MPMTNSTKGAAYVLKAGKTLRVTTNGEAFVDLMDGAPGAGYVSSRAQPGSVRIVGPFANDTLLRVRANGGFAFYDDATPTSVGLVAFGDSLTHHVYPQNRVMSLSRSNGVATIVLQNTPNYYFKGCAVDIVGVPDDFGGFRTITGGSSTTWTYDCPGPDVASVTGLTSNSYSANMSSYADPGFLTWMNIQSDYRLDLPYVVAGTGRTSAQILERMSEGLGKGAAVFVICAGKNDEIGGFDPAVTIANLEQMYTRALADSPNAIVIAVTIPPNGSAAYTQTRANFQTTVNAYIKSKVRSTARMYLGDIYGALVDPLNTTNRGQAKANMNNPADGVHLTQRGAQIAGKALAALVKQLFPLADMRPSSNADNYAVNPNSTFSLSGPWTNTGGTVNAAVTGVAPSGFQASRNGAATVAYAAPARADGRGYDMVATVTSSAAGDGSRILGPNPNIASLPAETVVQSEVTVAFTGVAGSNLQQYLHYLSMTVDGQTAIVGALAHGGSTGLDCVQEDWSGVLRTPKVALPVQPAAGLLQRTDTVCSAAGTQYTASFGLFGVGKS